MQRAKPAPSTTPAWAVGARRRVPFYLLASALLAILAGVVTFIYLERIRAASLPEAVALVTRIELRPGTVIAEEMVDVRAVPAAVVPAGRLTSPAQATGRVSLIALPAQAVILPEFLAGAGEGGLSRRLPDGRWAMVLPSGWLVTPFPELTAGDRVDLLAYQAGQPALEAAVILYARANGFQLLPLLRPIGS